MFFLFDAFVFFLFDTFLFCLVIFCSEEWIYDEGSGSVCEDDVMFDDDARGK